VTSESGRAREITLFHLACAHQTAAARTRRARILSSLPSRPLIVYVSPAVPRVRAAAFLSFFIIGEFRGIAESRAAASSSRQSRRCPAAGPVKRHTRRELHRRRIRRDGEIPIDISLHAEALIPSRADVIRDVSAGESISSIPVRGDRIVAVVSLIDVNSEIHRDDSRFAFDGSDSSGEFAATAVAAAAAAAASASAACETCHCWNNAHHGSRPSEGYGLPDPTVAHNNIRATTPPGFVASSYTRSKCALSRCPG